MAEVREDTPSCIIKTLPPDLLIPAARVAVEIEPRNAPPHVVAASFEPQHVAVMTSKYWGSKPRVLTVEYLDNPTPTFRRMFLEAANSWDCGVTFVEVARDGMVRLTRDGSGHWSYLGPDILMVPKGEPTMNLQGFTEFTAASEWSRVPPHEIGHTLGMPHEHLRGSIIARLNREAVYAWFARMGWSRQMVDANVFTPVEESALLQPTPPEETSIMTYQFESALTLDHVPIVGGTRLTDTDLSYVDLIYPKATGPTPPVTPPPPVEPPAPKPPEPKPKPKPPFINDLKVGRLSEVCRLPAGDAFLFRFTASSKRVFVIRTYGHDAWEMELMDADRRVIAADSLSGPGGNALIATTLRKGVYYLRIVGKFPEVAGEFRVKVSAI